MRTLALLGAAAIAASIAASNAAFAWSTETPAQQGGNALDLSDPDNFKALQDKVNGKTSSSSDGLHFYGSVNSGGGEGFSSTNPYGLQPLMGNNSGFNYSPNPGFRGLPQ